MASHEVRSPLIPGRLILRYKRFLADVTIAGGVTVTATCPNTGSMLGLTTPGLDGLAFGKRQPNAQIPPHLGNDRGRSRPGTRARRHQHRTSERARGRSHRRRRHARASRLRITPPRGEIRTVEPHRSSARRRRPIHVPATSRSRTCTSCARTASRNFPTAKPSAASSTCASFPQMVAQGHRAVMVFLVQRGDASRFKLASDIDPTYAAAFRARSRSRRRNALLQLPDEPCSKSPSKGGSTLPICHPAALLFPPAPRRPPETNRRRRPYPLAQPRA